jgi:hypothetical protein
MDLPTDDELHRLANHSEARVALIRQLESNMRILEALPPEKRAPHEDHIRQWRDRMWPSLRRELPPDEQ